MRDVGATQAIIVINGIKFVIDDSSRLKYANISTDYSQKVSSQYYPGIKNDRDLINLYKTLPHLGLSDFTRIILKKVQQKQIDRNFIDPFEQGSKIEESIKDSWKYWYSHPVDYRRIKNAPTLSQEITLSRLRTIPYVNVFKAVKDKNWYQQIQKTSKNHNIYASHFGSFKQAQLRYEVFEETGWRIFYVTFKLDNLYPELLIDNGASFNTSNKAKMLQIFKSGYSSVAYNNIAEGDGLSLVALNSSVIL